MSLAVSGMAADKEKTGTAERKAKAHEMTSPERGSRRRSNYKISIRIKTKGVDYATAVLVSDGQQSSFTALTTTTVAGINGGNTALKRTAIVANFLPYCPPEVSNNKVDVQMQIEFSSTGDPAGDVFIQIQTEVWTKKGKPIVLASDPDKHVELVIEDLE